VERAGCWRLPPWWTAVGGSYFEDWNDAPVVTRRSADYAGVAMDAVHQWTEWLWDAAMGLLRA
jgi:hypothetical protein